jgi:molybdate/tungstate transport system substrate-binding protein
MGRRNRTFSTAEGGRSRMAACFGVIAAAVSCIAAFVATGATGASGPVVIDNAGVLGSTITALKGSVPGVTITNTTGGSVALAQGIEAGTMQADLFGSADAAANQLLLGNANGNKERWFAAFGRNAIVMEYSPSPADPHAADFAKAAAGQEPWYQPLISGPAINLCRMSPDADPSGYYTLFVMQLAEKMYPSVATQLKAVLGDDRNPVQTSSTCSTGKSLANGTLDVSFTYLSSALSSPGTPFIALPAQINLSSQAEAKNYATATFTNSAGQTFHGGVIRPSIAPIQSSANPDGATAVLQYMFANQGSLLWWTQNFLPSGLYAGGDPAAIPTVLRPYFNLRSTQLTVGLDKSSCDRAKLEVTGGGATVVAAVMASGQCEVTVDAQPLQTGMRNLMLLKPGKGGSTLVDQSFPNAVDLTDAVPVVPSFLQS